MKKIIAKSYIDFIEKKNKDLFVFDRSHERKERSIEIDAFSNIWSIGMGYFPPGVLKTSHNDQIQEHSGDWIFFIPPFSLIQWHIMAGTLNWKGYYSLAPIPTDIELTAQAYQVEQALSFSSTGDIFDFLRKNESHFSIERTTQESFIGKATREKIKKTFNQNILLHDIAQELKTDPSIVSRNFKKDYGLSPIEYRNKLRVFESLKYLMMEGKKVSESGMETGFSDLSRFNKQFMKYKNAVPSEFICNWE